MSSGLTTIAQYRILQRIGAGARGEVFRARDEALCRVVALAGARLDSELTEVLLEGAASA